MVTQGEYYQDPSLPSSAITYQYTLVPSNYSLPTNVPYTVLYQVVLFDEDAGDEADPEEDPWIPDPPPGGYCYDEYGQAYVCGSSPRIYLRTKETLPDDLQIKMTTELLAAGLNPRDVYNEAMRIAGYPEEMIDKDEVRGRTQSTRYYPSGFIRVRDNVTGLLVPVKNIKVKARRWFKIDDTQTDANGNFVISKGYRQKAHIVLKYQNSEVRVRAISGLLKFWEYAQVLEKECGLFSTSQLNGINVNLEYNANADTYTALQWAGAHCLNTHFEMKQFSAARGLIGPYSNMNIWISSAITQAASTPMLRALTNTSQVSQAIDFLLPYTYAAAKKIVQNFLPDVTLRLQDNSSGPTRNADAISNTFFHEFGHSQHYSQAGNNYWASYIWYIVTNGGYGSKTTSGSGRVAVGESWGFFIGNTFNGLKYSNVTVVANRERDQLESNVPVDGISVDRWNTGSQGWIPLGMPHDLIDVGEPAVTGVVDNVSGYTVAGVFRGYTSSAATIQDLRSSILSNNSASQAAQVNALIASYRY